MKTTFILLILAVFSFMAFAQPQQSEDFRITKSVIDAGGAGGTSADFKLYNAFGQPTPIGVQTSADFVLYAGYLSPSFAVHPLSPIQELVIKVVPPNVTLYWDPIFGAERYKVFRDTIVTFLPGPSSLIGIVTDTTYTDLNATDILPRAKYFYCVEASNTPHPIVIEPVKPDITAAAKSAAVTNKNAPSEPRTAENPKAASQDNKRRK
ncbi:hypothetical protein EHM69_00560 [candidate division KSB1 bacterium]|nr:MAG: hypothetical protein EHM69_00560 [candidate division KSB1 bacterium]